MVVTQTPDANGKIVHVVQPYQALFTIADAYHVPVDRILELNGLHADTPLQIEQELVIAPGNITPSPTLSNIQKLTPEADGNYYHTVQSGETLSSIANVYDVPLSDLMNWNGLSASTVIFPGQKLLLRVTPPVTVTSTFAPATFTPPPPSVTTAPTSAVTAVVPPEQPSSGRKLFWLIGAVTLVIAGLLVWGFARKSDV
jgi:LysM repeat protein